jgi:hypothetical protein
MTTSSVYTYQLTRNQIIESALRKLGVLAEGQTPSTQNYADGMLALNTVIAQLRAAGMPLWARSEYTFTPTTNTYTIGTGMTLNTQFPVRLLQAFRTDNGAKIPMDLVAREDFNILPTNSTGIPLKVNYQPYINYGVVSLWPTPTSTNTTTVTLVYQRPFQYFTTSTETADFPEEWYNAIIYHLAVRLAPEWGVPLPDRQMLMQEAKMYTEDALMVGQEDASLFLQPMRGY